jgi:hypothetical protein
LSTAVRRAIYSKLAGDTTLNVGLPSHSPPIPPLLGTPASGYAKAIYHDPAPADASYPFIVISKSSGIPPDLFGPGGTDVWLIKGVAHDTTADTVEAIQDRIRVLLDNQSEAFSTISGAKTILLLRQSDVEYSEVLDGEVYRHAGALYRLQYQ